jgi:hypothetical protein
VAWKSWDVYVVQGDRTVHRGVTGGASRQSARELASTLFDIAKDKLMLVPKGGAGRKRRAATPVSALGSPRPKAANVRVYTRPSGYWYAIARDATTSAMIVDASGHSRAEALRELRGKFSMIGVAIKSITDEDWTT